MSLYAIADLHLPLGVDKPMNIFGRAWDNYVERLHENWQSVVKPEDTVILPGDFSWATYLEQSERDFEFLNGLNGKKYLVKGNHDYWWTTLKKMREFFSEHGFENIDFLQNNTAVYKDIHICGTRGWIHPNWEGFNQNDKRLHEREVLRLEASLTEARKQDAKRIFVFTHYPPMGQEAMPNAFTDKMREFGVERCIYGHLHAASHRRALLGVVDGIKYNLVSGDYLGFMPLKLEE